MRTLSKRSRDGGYLLVLLAVCVSILTLSFLRLAASSARSDDLAEAKVAGTAAFYAAETGLLVAEANLKSLTSAPPAAGVWLSGNLSTSRYKVQVSAEGRSATRFKIRSTGQASRDGEVVVSIPLEAIVVRKPKNAWTIVYRILE